MADEVAGRSAAAVSGLGELLISHAKARAIKRPGVWIPCDIPVLTIDLRPLRVRRLSDDGVRTDVRWLKEEKRYEERTIRVGRLRPTGIIARLARLFPRIVIEES